MPAITSFTSSTREIPESGIIPRHIAIIMDGNGRWAKNRYMPRMAGHKRGVETVRTAIKACIERGVEYLTLFAFSSENWRRPPDEVAFLMQLFINVLEQEVSKLHENGIRFKVIGDLSKFEPKIVEFIRNGGRSPPQMTASPLPLQPTMAGDGTSCRPYGRCWNNVQTLQPVSMRKT
jgi:undecaprenyl diphosphate synthase